MIKLTLMNDGSVVYIAVRAIEQMQPVSTGGTIIYRAKGGGVHVRQTPEQIFRTKVVEMW